MENVTKNTLWEEAAIVDAAREDEIENAQLLKEIGLLLPDYFMLKSMRQSADHIELEFYNGNLKKLFVQ